MNNIANAELSENNCNKRQYWAPHDPLTCSNTGNVNKHWKMLQGPTFLMRANDNDDICIFLLSPYLLAALAAVPTKQHFDISQNFAISELADEKWYILLYFPAKHNLHSGQK